MNLADVSIRRPVFAVMLIAALVVFGAVAYPRVGVDMFPNVEFPVVTVLVIFPGTDPETMERKVAEPIEEEINTLGGIRQLRSVNLEGVTQVVAMFELEIDTDQAVQDIRDRVARIEGDLPEGIEPPMVQKMDTGSVPVVMLALSGKMPIRDLTRLADKTVKQRIQRINGVGSVDLVGGREREIQVLVDPVRLSGVGLTVTDVAGAVRAQNLEIPAGTVELGNGELTVKTRGEVMSAEEIADILLPITTGAPLRIRDVAQVVDGAEDARSWSAFNGAPAVSLVVRKQSGTNTVSVAKAVLKAVDELKPRIEQSGAELSVASDNSRFIQASIESVQFDLLFGGALAVLIIFILLIDMRATLISALAIPTSVIATFAFINAMGFTFNTMTMLALSLSIGILIDDAIVVIENIHRHLERGKKPLQAASEATSEIFLAVLAMTSCILAVFVPVATMEGMIGRFFYEFGLTVSFAVATSMLVSFTLTPMLSSRLLKHVTHHEERGGIIARMVNGGMSAMERGYAALVSWSLKHRAVTLGVAVLALIASAAIVTRVPRQFIPSNDRSELSVNVELPTGTNLETSEKVLSAIADDLLKNAPGIKTVLASLGGGAQGQVNKGSVELRLVPRAERSFSQSEFMAWVRRRYSSVRAATVSVVELDMFGGSSGFRTQPVQFNLRGDDLSELAAVADKLKVELGKLPGFVDLDTTHRGGKPEIRVEINRERAAALGVSVASIASTVRAMLAGDSVSELKDRGDVYQITLRLDDAQKAQIEAMANLKVRSSNGQLVDLSNIVDTKRGFGPSQIERESQQKQITVLADLEKVALGTAMQQVEQAAAGVVPLHLVSDWGGQARFMGEAFGNMFSALFLAVVLVYMILAAQFNSFIQPITIMLSLPLSVVGAFGALYLSEMALSVFSMIGIIMLMGLVTKNAILLVDFANQRRERGMKMHDALVEAGRLRLRPILMTTAAMIFGMLPVAMAHGEGGETRAPMAVCVVGGLITSTLLTLVVVPVVYTLFDGLGNNRAVRWLESKVFAKSRDEQGRPRTESA
ncbi:MAG: efflux RND transporter permease subunit [Deltaproteobacteria bacterium]|nr:efflux RND transporter permease subunit [Deltaproteobacteria bacterium]